MKRRLTALTFVGLLLLLTIGCASKPETEVTEAQQAFEGARSAEADVYAPEDFRVAQDSLKEAEAELAAQDSKFALTRSYEQAVAVLKRTRDDAEKAASAAKANRENVMKEAQTAQVSAQTAIAETRELMAKAPTGKGTRADLEALAGDLAGAETAFQEAEQLLSQQKYLGARDQFQGVLEQVGAIRSEIEAAIARKGRR